MLSYPLQEASDLLADKLVAARQQLANLVEDVEFLKEQITIMEVNTARVYNFDVKRCVPLILFYLPSVGSEREGEVWGKEDASTRSHEGRRNADPVS